MGTVLSLLASVMGIVSLVCWIMVLIKMFQNDAVVPAILSIVLIFCLVGPLVAFFYGWSKADAWNVRRVMVIWTVCLVLGILLNVGAALLPHQVGI